jgi:hypothetical protein
VRRRPALAALCVALALVAAACGGGDDRRPSGTSLPLGEYFQRLQAADDESEQRFDRLEAQLAENLPEDQALALLKQVYPQQVAILKDLLGDTEALVPSAEVADAHDEAVDALRDFVDISEDTADQVADAQSLREVSERLSVEASSEANQRLIESCLALEQAGTANGMTIDLDCE